MPRNGSGIYTQPFADVVEDTTIESAIYNGFTHDIETDLNQPRPIVAGGTGATNANDALKNLSAEKAAQSVTSFDSHVWLTGSFSSGPSAENAPVAGHGFTGHVVVADPLTSQWIMIEAHDLNDTTVPGRNYIREKKGGVWGPWTVNYVSGAGGTMTGDLTIDKTPWPTLFLKTTRGGAEGPGSGCAIVGLMDANKRWQISLGNEEAEANIGGSPPTLTDQGSNFSIQNFSNSGVALGTPLHINRATGAVTVDKLNTTGGPSVGASAGSGLFGNTSALGLRAFPGGAISFTGPNGTPVYGYIDANGFSSNNYVSAKGTVYVDSLTAGSSPSLNLRDFAATPKGAFWWDPATNENKMGGGGTQTLFTGPAYVASSHTTAYKPGGGAWLDGSDARIKTVHGGYASGLAEVLLLNPVRFTYNATDTHEPNPTKDAAPYESSIHYDVAVAAKEFIGLVAQEAETVMPELVTQREGYINGVKVTDMRDLDATPLIFALINAVKELTARIEQLENPA